MAKIAKVRGADHDFQQIGDGRYRLTILSLGTLLEVDRLRRERQELIGELSVACDLAGAKSIDGYIHLADFNLSSATARTQRAKILADRSDADDLDWASFLEELCQRTIAAERAGTPARPLHMFDRPGPDAEFEVDGWRLLRDHATIVFGDGGSAKSYLALFVAGQLASRGVQVLYADWELAGSDHRDRLERLFGADMPTVQYLRCDRPLLVEADRVSREVRRHAIEYLVCDSIAFATGGPPEAAEHATAYFRALRQIGIGSLNLAHVTKAENGDQKPFGSSFWHNSARSTWFVKLASTSPDGECHTIGVINRKANLTALRPAVGFTVTFDAARTSFQRINVADIPELAQDMPLWQRMKTALRTGPATIAQLADDLGVKVDTVDRTVRRRDGLFTRVLSPDGVRRIALVERRQAP